MLLYPNAKINLGLKVIGKREDGYHELQTIFYPIQLCDELEISSNNTADDIRLSFDGGMKIDCGIEDNLIVRTCRMFQKETAIGGVDIRFRKNIPFGAGLGGGSSDAAHTALALNDVFDLGLSKERLRAMVSSLGADCAFFIENKPCVAYGIGDRLTKINLDLSEYKILLVKPDIHVSTKEAYAGIDNCPNRKTVSPDITEIIKMPMSDWRKLLVNDFEESVFTLYPQIGAIKQKLYSLGAIYASMTGSGSCVFGLFDSSIDEDKLQLTFDSSVKIFFV